MKRFLGLLLCTVLFTFLAAQCSIAQAPAPVVSSVEVTGLLNSPADAQNQVSNIIKPLTGKPFDQAAVDAAVKDIENIGYFFSASASQTPDDGGVRVVFSIMENRVISTVQFVGNVSFTDTQLLAVMKNKPGQMLNDKFAVQDQQAILMMYAKAGYAFTDVSTPTFVTDANDPDKIVLTIEIFEPRISEVRIIGAKKTRPVAIRRQLAFKAGDIVNLIKQQESLRNLINLGIFDETQTTITYEPGTEPNALIANVNIVERNSGTASLGLSLSQVQQLTGFISIADNNFFGTTDRVKADLSIGSETGYNLSFTNPWIDPKRTSFTVNAYDFSTIRQAFVGTLSLRYDERRSGFDTTFTRPISKNLRGSIGFRDNVIKATEDTAITDPAIRDVLLTEKTVISTTLGLIYDSRNYPLRPFHGSYRNITTEVAGLGGAGFLKIFGENREYFVVKRDKTATEREFPRNWVYATRVMAGISSGNPPFLDQFFLGGSETLRGYEQDRFPGANMVLWNNELRVPLNDSLDLVGFVDAGEAWHGSFARQFGDTAFKLHVGYGLGIRLLLPAVGPLRLDYGINETGKGIFTFAFGPTF